MAIIGTAPIILGVAAGVIGSQHRKILMHQAETERLVVERTQQLSEANLQLAELLRAKDQFVSVISHELRNPLTAVIGFAGQLRETVPDSDREIAALVELEGQAAANIIEDLLVAARADIGEVAVHPSEVDLSELAAGCVEVFSRQCQASSITSELEPSPAMADPIRVRQIIRNLLTNAARYGGSSVRVETGTGDGRASICVIDDGDGVADLVAESLFEPYGHDAASQSSESVGLGLHVSRTLARLMGGDLSYERASGETRFRLVLPSPLGRPVDRQVADSVSGI
jgi:signal transduction histidine kinase